MWSGMDQHTYGKHTSRSNGGQLLSMGKFWCEITGGICGEQFAIGVLCISYNWIRVGTEIGQVLRGDWRAKGIWICWIGLKSRFLGNKVANQTVKKLSNLIADQTTCSNIWTLVLHCCTLHLLDFIIFFVWLIDVNQKCIIKYFNVTILFVISRWEQKSNLCVINYYYYYINFWYDFF